VQAASRKLGLVGTKRDLCVLDALAAMGPHHGKIEGLNLEVHREANCRREAELKFRSEKVVNVFLNISVSHLFDPVKGMLPQSTTRLRWSGFV
jgi:hypothetical protein